MNKSIFYGRSMNYSLLLLLFLFGATHLPSFDSTKTTNQALNPTSLTIKEMKMTIGGSSYSPVEEEEEDYSDVDQDNLSNKDMLTPEYYNGGVNRDDANKFVHFAHKVQMHHPLETWSGYKPSYYVRSAFNQYRSSGYHHTGIDLGVSIGTDIHAAHNGFVTEWQNFDTGTGYGNHVYLTKNINDDDGNYLGKVATMYAHLSEARDYEDMYDYWEDDYYVDKGEYIGKSGDSGNAKGTDPHLHFEIRYYRKNDKGWEKFYSRDYDRVNNPVFANDGNNYGYWDSQVGYGFGNPSNHGLTF